MDRTYWVYIMTNPTRTVLYTGVTGNIAKRVFEHKQKLVPGFTSKYNVTLLVYAEAGRTAMESIEREKQIKAGSHRKKVSLIESINPEWKDLYETL